MLVFRSSNHQNPLHGKPNQWNLPDSSVKPTDIFSHWPIDFAGSDSQTGCRYVFLAVEWESRWQRYCLEAVVDVVEEMEEKRW